MGSRMRSSIVCPSLKTTAEGAICRIASHFIGDVNDTGVKVCMSRHYESCFIYLSGLKGLTVEPALTDTFFKPHEI